MKTDQEELKAGEIYVRLQYLNDRKVIDIIKTYEDKTISFHKEELTESESISSTVLQTKEGIVINP